MMKIRTGLENLIESPPEWLQDKRLGLLCNPASVDNRLNHARFLINDRFKGKLSALFSPQHGFFAEKQDNMIESADLFDPVLNIPVYSLYGHTRQPTDKMMEAIDVLIVDLIDVGTRVYTFLTTLSYCLEIAAQKGKTVLILDRPNPIGGLQVEGNLLDVQYASFVGRYKIPMRHGLTVGEYASYINHKYSIGCSLEIINMSGWKRQMYFNDTGLFWVPPSPNLPTAASTILYPGQVIWEGTNISEGRGTTQPFELLGAPFIDTGKILSNFNVRQISGAILRSAVFEPTSNKWAQTPCRGFQIHVTDPHAYEPYEAALRLMSAIIYHHSEEFEYKAPPYEYEWEKLPFDLITGDPEIRSAIESGCEISELKNRWKSELEMYKEEIRPFLIYD